jgi:hypothetical protein
MAIDPGWVSNYEAILYLPHARSAAMMIDTFMTMPDQADFLHNIPVDLSVIS